jgi:hypothetical protein
MVEEKNEEKNKGVGGGTPAPTNVRRKNVREVLVTHLDAPPPSGKREIHPRRPAPIVPTREERTGEQAENPSTKKPASE